MIFSGDRLSNGSKHYFFGFHDIVCSDEFGRYVLALETEIIDRPPIPGQSVSVGYISTENGEFTKLSETEAFNFPQGARQQWIPRTLEFVFNKKNADGWGAVRMDLGGHVVMEYDRAIYAISPGGDIAMCLNFERMHRLGGYGYIGIEDVSQADDAESGVIFIDVKTGNRLDSFSLSEVMACGDFTVTDASLHYLTHAVWSPDGRRVVFLHRYWLPDGGLTTRVLCFNIESRELKLLAVGEYSHSAWQNEQSIMIWGRRKSALDAARSMRGTSARLISPLLAVARKFKRRITRRALATGRSSYLRINVLDGSIEPIGVSKLTRDGHPMCNRIYSDWVAVDDYPDAHGVRNLMLFNFLTEQVTHLGSYRKLDALADMESIEQAQYGMDPRVLKKFDVNEFAFTRSGLHCDLHPRWGGDFKHICFDSIHEGTRQMYWMDVAEFISGASGGVSSLSD
ncbi:hypothetical protein [Cerasicoccus arenae]|uniref:Uncharacterized protein n=1 Tax=Cerasicoccus arenae TaxID=424488 RepID=A0A8J3DCM0_9BACT|nr:hypothetical protein [Cerasicoccus arenae]MBK1858641.1 hypothetical protein [Cerasicoccus arenae]GHC04827.1 hypothetical protein GCM10007047_22100 [Cerasicoccus arenae]